MVVLFAMFLVVEDDFLLLLGIAGLGLSSLCKVVVARQIWMSLFRGMHWDSQSSQSINLVYLSSLCMMVVVQAGLSSPPCVHWLPSNKLLRRNLLLI